MTKTVKSYLESYFLAGNMNRIDRMSAKDMAENVPEITPVASWITQNAASLKKQSAIEKIAEGSSTARNIHNFQEIAKSSIRDVNINSEQEIMLASVQKFWLFESPFIVSSPFSLISKVVSAEIFEAAFAANDNRKVALAVEFLRDAARDWYEAMLQNIAYTQISDSNTHSTHYIPPLIELRLAIHHNT
ncbi:14171_t:CDS:2 [Rhizophagus irregularis]|nr:14171_t:CDS:2 [Rhizophagus irregularis]